MSADAWWYFTACYWFSVGWAACFLSFVAVRWFRVGDKP